MRLLITLSAACMLLLASCGGTCTVTGEDCTGSVDIGGGQVIEWDYVADAAAAEDEDACTTVQNSINTATSQAEAQGATFDCTSTWE